MAAPANKRAAKKSRSQRIKHAAATKQPAAKKVEEAVVETQEQSTKDFINDAELPNAFKLIKRALVLLFTHRVLFGGIIALYALASLIFVTGGFGYGYDAAVTRDAVGNRITGSIAAYTQLIGGSGGSQAAAAINFFLLLIVSIVLVWALRQVVAGKLPTIRDAYYKGTYPLIPVLLLVALIALQLLPMVIGVNVYQLIVQNGIAQNMEVIWWGLGSIALSLVSLYFLTSSVIALYIATLPDMTPMMAIRSSRTLLRGRRWTVLRKILFLPLFLFVAGAIILTPIIILLPRLAEGGVFVLTVLAIPITHAYMYYLYRGLMRD